MLSPLTQGRGLKLAIIHLLVLVVKVAPHTGAWIETSTQPSVSISPAKVAPHTGAWIETTAGSTRMNILTSPLTQGRGLKPCISAAQESCERGRPSHRGVD